MAAVSMVNAAGFAPVKFAPQEAKKNSPAKVDARISNSPLANCKAFKALPVIDDNILRAKSIRKADEVKPEEEETSQDAFFESFEEWPMEEFDLEWLPEGWTAERKASVDDMESWFPMYQYYGYPEPADGQYYFMIMYGEDQDEWLITPQIEIGEGQDLFYYLYYQPFYLFSDENLDFDTYEYDGEKIIAATFQVLVKAEGDEDWTLLQDIADRYKDYNAMELMLANPTGLQRQNVSLADFAGKKVQFGFRYVGTDGDAMWFDAVRIGVTPLDAVSYSLPANTFYWGYTSGLAEMTIDIAQVPVFEPITFTNTSEENATYVWNYMDPITGEAATSDNQINLELVYQPDYTDEETIANNLYIAPTLTASAPGKASASYTASMFIQAGGTSTMSIDGETYEFSIFPFAHNNADVGGITVNDTKIGDMSVPVFGHSMHTNEYWYNYTAGDDPDATPETCYNHLEGIANLYMPEQGKNLVVNGIYVFGFGLFHADAEIKFSIYGLKQLYDEDGDPSGISTDPSDYKVIATKTINGSDILYTEGNSDQKDYICLPFNFDESVVVTATEEYPAFFFMLEGFNSDAVEYFMPFQTRNALPGTMNLAYMLSEINFEVASGRPTYYSVKPLLYVEDGDLYRPESAFAFGLLSDFPWLIADTNDVTIGAEESEVKVALSSYYDGSQLTVEASEGLVAEVAGRYDECELTISRVADSTAELDGTVTVKGPSVEVTVNVHADEVDSISEAIGAKATAAEAYDLFGRRTAKTANGLYIIKYNDGSVRKQVIVK